MRPLLVVALFCAGCIGDSVGQRSGVGESCTSTKDCVDNAICRFEVCVARDMGVVDAATDTQPRPVFCVPGRTVPCACADGSDGAQRCLGAEGYGPCECGATPDPDAWSNAQTRLTEAVNKAVEPEASTGSPVRPRGSVAAAGRAADRGWRPKGGHERGFGVLPRKKRKTEPSRIDQGRPAYGSPTPSPKHLPSLSHRPAPPATCAARHTQPRRTTPLPPHPARPHPARFPARHHSHPCRAA